MAPRIRGLAMRRRRRDRDGWRPCNPPTAATACAGEARRRGSSPLPSPAGSTASTGADYQRAFALPTAGRCGRSRTRTWLAPGAPTGSCTTSGIVQDGSCFTVLRTGSDADPGPWIGADATEPFQRWFWPLGGIVADDGTVRLFVAELREQATATSRTASRWRRGWRRSTRQP